MTFFWPDIKREITAIDESIHSGYEHLGSKHLSAAFVAWYEAWTRCIDLLDAQSGLSPAVILVEIEACLIDWLNELLQLSRLSPLAKAWPQTIDRLLREYAFYLWGLHPSTDRWVSDALNARKSIPR